jgi:DNA-binding transcriptional LysR family regulator
MDLLEAVKTFVAVAEHESFAEAARRLNRSPAAVTRAVAMLEGDGNVRLFNRTTRSVSLTDAGQRYLDVARRLLAAHAELDEFSAGEQTELRGALSLTAPTVFGRLHVLPLVASFLDAHPNVDIRLFLIDRIVSLVDEGMDLGVRLGNLPDSSLRAIRVGTMRRCVYASPAYLKKHGVPQTPQDLAQHSVVSCVNIHAIGDRWTFKTEKGLTSFAVRPRLVVNTIEAALDAAVHGLGLTAFLAYQAQEQVEAGQLAVVLENYELPPLPIHILHPPGRHLPLKVRAFLDHISAGLRAKFAGSQASREAAISST